MADQEFPRKVQASISGSDPPSPQTIPPPPLFSKLQFLTIGLAFMMDMAMTVLSVRMQFWIVALLYQQSMVPDPQHAPQFIMVKPSRMAVPETTASMRMAGMSSPSQSIMQPAAPLAERRVIALP